MKGERVRSLSGHLTLLGCLVIGFGSMGVSPAIAQTPVTSIEDLRHELTAGDFITVVPAVGLPVAGRLIRFGNVDLEVRPANQRGARASGPRDVTIALDAVQSVERRRDPARNGAAIGAGIGAAYGGAMFVHAMVIDRNEMDEWATFYVGGAAVCAGIGALIGWAVDAARSKPHIRFTAASVGRTAVSVQPVYTRGRGIALAVSLSR
jgi:hypothetical protein